MTRLDRLTANPPQTAPDRHEIGNEDGETCNRVHEPDEDAPRGYKPKPCSGVMSDDDFATGAIFCDTCGKIGDWI